VIVTSAKALEASQRMAITSRSTLVGAIALVDATYRRKHPPESLRLRQYVKRGTKERTKCRKCKGGYKARPDP
jgi:hypothetical protein